MRWSALAFTLMLCSLALAPQAAAQTGPTLAISYFDNNSKDPELDVLRKGFADWLITDLSGVEGIQLVERDKLEQLVKELELGQSKFIDPKTAGKLGKGLAAQYILTGSYLVIHGQVRLDARLLKVETSAIVMAEKVSGAKDDLLSLAPQLAAKLAPTLGVSMSDSSGRAKVAAGSAKISLEAFTSYSRGLAASDAGDFETATKQLKAASKTTPGFTLAKTRYKEALKKLYEARAKRTTLFDTSREQLLKSADTFLKKGPVTKRTSKSLRPRLLGYRAIRGIYLMSVLQKTLKAEYAKLRRNERAKKRGRVPLGKAKEYKEFIRLYINNQMALVDDLVTIGAHGASQQIAIEKRDFERAEVLKLETTDSGFAGSKWQADSYPKFTRMNAAHAAADTALFILTGQITDDSGAYKQAVLPAPATLDPTLIPDAIGLLQTSLRESTGFQVGVLKEWNMRLVASLNYACGNHDEALEQWQAILDQYPGSDSFDMLEASIKHLLGVENCQRNDCFDAALAGDPASITSCQRKIPWAEEMKKKQAGQLDPRNPTPFYAQKCQSGDMAQCNNLAVSFAKGQGVAKDTSRARGLYKMACSGGYMMSCTNLGTYYLNGTGGLTKDPSQAASLYTKACDGGQMGACARLAVQYNLGEGVPKDPKRARDLNKRACDAQEKIACENLSGSYNNLGWADLTKGKFKAAETHLNTALKFSPKSPVAQLNLSHALLFQGRYEAAWKIIERWKDRPCPWDQFDTWSALVLADYGEFEKTGVVPRSHREKFESFKGRLKGR